MNPSNTPGVDSSPAPHSHDEYAAGFDDGKAQVIRSVSAALALLDVAARLRDVGDLKARDLERQARALLADASGVPPSPRQPEGALSICPAHGERHPCKVCAATRTGGVEGRKP